MHDTMSTQQPHSPYCPDDVVEFNIALGDTLEKRFQMTLATWKTVKWAAIFAGMVVILTAEGADPMFRVIAVALILAGPELLEYIAVREDFEDYVDNQDDDE